MKRDVLQPTQTLCADGGQPSDGIRLEHAVAYDAQSSRAFGDEHASVGQELDEPHVGLAPFLLHLVVHQHLVDVASGGLLRREPAEAVLKDVAVEGHERASVLRDELLP